MSRKTRSLSVKSVCNSLWLPILCLFLTSNIALAEEPFDGLTKSNAATVTANSGNTVQDKKKAKVPKGVDVYMGRRVAQTMHYLGAEWLIRNEREREERCSLMLANLGIRKGMTICDMGCGNGFHSLAMAKMTGKNGLVLGVDVQPEMLGFLRERMEADGIEKRRADSRVFPQSPPSS